MKSYELIIERRQPPCGGKPTKLYDFQNVETDDPVAYVRQYEPGLSQDADLEVHYAQDGTVSICFTSAVSSL